MRFLVSATLQLQRRRLDMSIKQRFNLRFDYMAKSWHTYPHTIY